MNNRAVIMNLLGTLAVLFAMLFQPVHEIAHLRHELDHEKCLHASGVTGVELTHAHDPHDNCFLCHFVLGSYVAPGTTAFNAIQINGEIPYFFSLAITSTSFSGNSSFLRGPPVG